MAHVEKENEMIITDIEQKKEAQIFALEAAAAFKQNSKLSRYSRSNLPEAGELRALRCGPRNDCVLVVQRDESFEPRNYTEIIK